MTYKENVNKSLQAKYRLERDQISTYETDEFYFAYQTVEDEFHILEMYIVEEKRGCINIYFDQMYEFIRERFPKMKFMIATVIPSVPNSEKMLMSLLKYKFKLISARDNKITVCWEIV